MPKRATFYCLKILENAKVVTKVFRSIFQFETFNFFFRHLNTKRKNRTTIKLRFLSTFYRLSFIKLSILTGKINQTNQWVIFANYEMGFNFNRY